MNRFNIYNDMKSKQEIINYITKKDWYPLFVKYHHESNVDEDPTAAWRLVYDSDLIKRAFDWNATTESPLFWRAVDSDYRMWYYGKLRTEPVTL